MTKYLIHTCDRCRRLFIWYKVGEWKQTICPECELAMTPDEQRLSLRRMEERK